MRNNKGPNTDPCGIPEDIVLYSDFLPFITTACLLFCHSFKTIMPNCLLYQLLFSSLFFFFFFFFFFFSFFLNNPLCHTRSKALEMSGGGLGGGMDCVVIP